MIRPEMPRPENRSCTADSYRHSLGLADLYEQWDVILSPSLSGVESPNGTIRLLGDSEKARSNLRSSSAQGASVSGDVQVQMSRFEIWSIVTPLIILVFTDFLFLASTIPIISPSITDEFLSLKDLSWYQAANTLAQAVVSPLTGPMYRYIKPKWCLLFFLALHICGSVTCGFAPSSRIFIIGRAITGAAGAGVNNGALVVVAAIIPMDKRPVYIASITGVAQVGSLLGPFVGGTMTEKLSWRWNFYIATPCLFIAAVMLACTRVSATDIIERPAIIEVVKRPHRYIDLVGLALTSGAVTCLILGLGMGGVASSWKSPRIVALLASSGVLSVVLVLWLRRKGDASIFPVSIMRQRPIWSSAVTAMAGYGAAVALNFFIPLYFQAVRGASAPQSAIWTMPATPSFIVVAIITSLLIQRYVLFQPIVLFGNLTHVAVLALISTLRPNSKIVLPIVYLCLAAVGRGIVLQAPTTCMQATLSPEEIPYGQPFLNFGEFVASSITSTVSNTIFQSSLTRGLTRGGLSQSTIDAVLKGGATSFRSEVNPDQLPTVIEVYSGGTRNVLFLAIALAIVGMFSSWGMGRVDIRRGKEVGGAAPR